MVFLKNLLDLLDGVFVIMSFVNLRPIALCGVVGEEGYPYLTVLVGPPGEIGVCARAVLSDSIPTPF